MIFISRIFQREYFNIIFLNDSIWCVRSFFPTNYFSLKAALGYVNPDINQIEFNCGGVVISDRYILTISHPHCVGQKRPVVVRLGVVSKIHKLWLYDLKFWSFFEIQSLNLSSFKQVNLLDTNSTDLEIQVNTNSRKITQLPQEWYFTILILTFAWNSSCSNGVQETYFQILSFLWNLPIYMYFLNRISKNIPTTRQNMWKMTSDWFNSVNVSMILKAFFRHVCKLIYAMRVKKRH